MRSGERLLCADRLGLESCKNQNSIESTTQRRQAPRRQMARGNGMRIIADPSVALDAITHQQSTFTQRDIAKFAHRHSDGPEQFNKRRILPHAKAAKVSPGGSHRCVAFAWRVVEACLAVAPALNYSATPMCRDNDPRSLSSVYGGDDDQGSAVLVRNYFGNHLRTQVVVNLPGDVCRHRTSQDGAG